MWAKKAGYWLRKIVSDIQKAKKKQDKRRKTWCGMRRRVVWKNGIIIALEAVKTGITLFER